MNLTALTEGSRRQIAWTPTLGAPSNLWEGILLYVKYPPGDTCIGPQLDHRKWGFQRDVLGPSTFSVGITKSYVRFTHNDSQSFTSFIHSKGPCHLVNDLHKNNSKKHNKTNNLQFSSRTRRSSRSTVITRASWNKRSVWDVSRLAPPEAQPTTVEACV